METQYSRTNCGPGGCTTYEPLFPVCPNYIWGSTELIACSTGWVTAESITVLHLKKEKQRGQALVWLSTASSAKRRGLFKTALKAGGVEQTDKLSRAVWQADGEGLVLCIDLPWGNIESLHYHHPPTTHPGLHEIIPSPPQATLSRALQSGCRLRGHEPTITRWYNAQTDCISSFCMSVSPYSQHIELKIMISHLLTNHRLLLHLLPPEAALSIAAQMLSFVT